MSGDVSILTYNDYAEVINKFKEAELPDYVYCDYAHPVSTLYFTPVPNQDCIVTIWSEKPHAKPDSIHDFMVFPEEFIKMLKFNLAVNIAGEFGVAPSETVRKIAAESLADINKYTRKQITAQP